MRTITIMPKEVIDTCKAVKELLWVYFPNSIHGWKFGDDDTCMFLTVAYHKGLISKGEYNHMMFCFRGDNRAKIY